MKKYITRIPLIGRLIVPAAIAAVVCVAHAGTVQLLSDGFEAWPQNPEHQYWPMVTETGWSNSGPGADWDGAALYGISNAASRTGTQSLFFKSLASTSSGNAQEVSRSIDVSGNTFTDNTTLSWNLYYKSENFTPGEEGANVYVRTRFYNGDTLLDASETAVPVFGTVSTWEQLTYNKSLTGTLQQTTRVEIVIQSINWTAVDGGVAYIDDFALSLSDPSWPTVPEPATYAGLAGLAMIAWAVFCRSRQR